MDEAWTLETGMHSESEGWSSRLLCMGKEGRELLRVTPGGEVWIAPDLTMDEARELIEKLALTCAKTYRTFAAGD